MKVTYISFLKAILFLLVLSGFTGSALFSFSIGPVNIFIYRLLFPVMMVLFGFSFLFNQGKINISHIKVRPYLQFLGFWLMYASITLLWSESKSDAILEILFLYMITVIIWFIVYFFHTIKDLNRFYYLWLTITVVINLIGFWELLTGQHLAISKSNEMFLDHKMPTAFFRNPNDFATVITLSLPFVITFIRYSKKFLPVLFGFAILASSMFLVISTGSRANLLAIIIGLVFWYIFLLPSKKKATVLLSCIVVIGFFSIVFSSQLSVSISSIAKELGTINLENFETSGTSLNIRMNLIKNALSLMAGSFGFGLGAGNFEHQMTLYANEFTAGIVNAHNWWFEILANYGLGVFVGYMVFYISLIRKLLLAYKNLVMAQDKRICEALLVGLISFSIASTSSSSIMTLRPQWFFFAFALAFLNYYRGCLKRGEQN